MIDLGWLYFLRLPLLGPRLRTTLGLVALLITIPADPGQCARLHVPRGVGWAVAGAAQTILLDPQDLGGRFRSLLPSRAGGGPPLWSTRLSSAGGGVEGSRLRLRLIRDLAVSMSSAGRRGVVGRVIWVQGEVKGQLLQRPRLPHRPHEVIQMIQAYLVVEQELLIGGLGHQLRVMGTIDEAAEGFFLLGCVPGAEVAEGGGTQPLDPPPPRSHVFGGILTDFTAV